MKKLTRQKTANGAIIAIVYGMKYDENNGTTEKIRMQFGLIGWENDRLLTKSAIINAISTWQTFKYWHEDHNDGIRYDINISYWG